MKKDTNSVFAKNLNRLMTEKKITVERAAEHSDVSKSNIVSWRSGVAPTNFDAVKKLSELLGVSFIGSSRFVVGRPVSRLIC